MLFLDQPITFLVALEDVAGVNAGADIVEGAVVAVGDDGLLN